MNIIINILFKILNIFIKSNYMIKFKYNFGISASYESKRIKVLIDIIPPINDAIEIDFVNSTFRLNLFKKINLKAKANVPQSIKTVDDIKKSKYYSDISNLILKVRNEYQDNLLGYEVIYAPIDIVFNTVEEYYDNIIVTKKMISDKETILLISKEIPKLKNKNIYYKIFTNKGNIYGTVKILKNYYIF